MPTKPKSAARGTAPRKAKPKKSLPSKAEERAPQRRTQTERKDASVERLVAATIDALYEAGYAATTVQEICRRADLSHGGLFRHFESRISLLQYVAKVLADGLLVRFRREFVRARPRTPDEIALTAQLVRSIMRGKEHVAWFELTVAARTNADLREAIAPLRAEIDAGFQSICHELLHESVSRFPDFPGFVDGLVTFFRGETAHRFATISPKADAERMQYFLATVERAYGAR